MSFLKTLIASSLMVTAFPAMSQEKANLDRNDPDAIRCKRLQVTGSLVRKTRVCKTNAEWKAIVDYQNREAADLVERNRSGTVMGN